MKLVCVQLQILSTYSTRRSELNPSVYSVLCVVIAVVPYKENFKRIETHNFEILYKFVYKRFRWIEFRIVNNTLVHVHRCHYKYVCLNVKESRAKAKNFEQNKSDEKVQASVWSIQRLTRAVFRRCGQCVAHSVNWCVRERVFVCLNCNLASVNGRWTFFGFAGQNYSWLWIFYAVVWHYYFASMVRISQGTEEEEEAKNSPNDSCRAQNQHALLTNQCVDRLFRFNTTKSIDNSSTQTDFLFCKTDFHSISLWQEKFY